ncbi:hypothetical protein A2954_05595 [Candidatus Roizmanbacteria bacterium RIFCSPLOWO2_01_FULL_37_12]|uniref:Uncharacterized protein n=1 Tax=Candidatus Roizmanbacteria bacterium RIFCSPLOWO2_01_FULL_37_12 TaxID=1802056 RepID=A0A1F7IBQ6_9BACT|nr:MAG: hypothetical protein A2768_02335 [Candidatus Roizmanbacteria bacterium RIFCSPHIGHO2_01_FULL_37_16]OGK24935.1 MAG: hypothetical protein A3D76_02890 [Candidatus Roizmanbacteria bacterium RIFCSPHIGHO2_02_FULL_37_9b]OGK40782.1 MAG: hypothetical protein A2954_05595 [Candidatus Roizmanbacteria bacterium RIFCSPLOWO2_01_FULL_37_12]
MCVIIISYYDRNTIYKLFVFKETLWGGKYFLGLTSKSFKPTPPKKTGGIFFGQNYYKFPHPQTERVFLKNIITKRSGKRYSLRLYPTG